MDRFAKMKPPTPEKLNLWDRLFNRYRKEVIEEVVIKGSYRDLDGAKIPNSESLRRAVKYRVIDRLTGSETIKLEYL